MDEDLSCVQATSSEADIAAATIGGARPHGGSIHLAEYDAAWPQLYAQEADRIAKILGGVVKRIEHIGSTSVPGPAAKPIVDIVMEVADSTDESAYVLPLAAHGYVLRVREPDWHEHRMLRGPETDINLHVFTIGCPEVVRMTCFRDHMRGNPIDRQFYETTKRELASRHWPYIQNYADAKSDVIKEIMARAKRATIDEAAKL